MSVQAVLDEIRERPPGTGDAIPTIDPATEEQITEFTIAGPRPSTTRWRARKPPRHGGVVRQARLRAGHSTALSEDEKTWVLGQTARQILKWPAPQ
jgi:hypothetical protein